MLPVEFSESDGVDGVGVGAEEDGHLTVGGARMVLQVIFVGFVCEVEIVFCFCVPEFLQDLVDRPNLRQAHEGVGPAFGLFLYGAEMAVQDVIQQGAKGTGSLWHTNRNHLNHWGTEMLELFSISLVICFSVCVSGSKAILQQILSVHLPVLTHQSFF